VSHARLLQLLAVVEQRDHALHEWGVASLQRWRNGESFDRAFSLVGPDANKAAREALLDAAGLLDPEGRRGPWELSEMLEKALARFESDKWPSAQYLIRPDSLRVLDQCFWRALICSNKIPRRQDSLCGLLAQKRVKRQMDAFDRMKSVQPWRPVPNDKRD